jgi:hypothetical protein
VAASGARNGLIWCLWADRRGAGLTGGWPRAVVVFAKDRQVLT